MSDVGMGDIAVERVAKRLQDFGDLQNELSGVTGPRAQRFLGRDDIRTASGKRKKEASDSAQRALHDVLLNKIYADARQAANTVVRETLNLADDVLQRLREQELHISEAIQVALEGAPTLPDGRKVFRDANGVVWDENGNRVKAEIAAGILWTGHEPSYEYYQSLLEAEAEVEAAIAQAQGLEAELGDLHAELNNDDAPPTLERIEEIEGEVRDIGTELEALGTFQIETNQMTPTDEIAASPTPVQTASSVGLPSNLK